MSIVTYIPPLYKRHRLASSVVVGAYVLSIPIKLAPAPR
jgi:hypothetical protein